MRRPRARRLSAAAASFRPTGAPRRNGWCRPARTAARRRRDRAGRTLPHHRLGLKPARIIERLGAMGDARSVSLIAIHTHDIPQVFPPAALEEAEGASAATLGHRTDLRDIPLVTIDGEDARDFDDAVFAEPDGRLPPDRRDRRCRAYVRPGSRARPCGAHARQQRVFPRPRRADAAGGTVQRLVQPAPERRSRLPVRRNAHRCRRPQAVAPVRPRPDAQRRAPHLRAGAAGA